MPASLRTRRAVEDDSNDWIMTFADVISLLLAFYVLILSTASIDIGKQEALAQGFASMIDGEEAPTPFTDIKDGLNQIVEESGLQDSVQVELLPDGVHMEFSDLSLFKPGRADFSEKAKKILTKASGVILENSEAHYLIEIEGHTDDTPISNAQFASNWELSSARSTGVVRHFISLGVDPLKLKGAAYADTRPKIDPFADGIDIKSARAANRRIVIFVHR